MKQKHILFLFLWIILSQTSLFSQVFECGGLGRNSWTQAYCITEKQGLGLRESASLEADMLGTIPFASRIGVCEGSFEQDSMPENDAQWVRVFWQEKEGYILSTLKQIEKEKAIMEMFPRSDLEEGYKEMIFPKGQKVFGLFKMHDGSGRLVLRSIPLDNTQTGDQAYPIDADNLPEWVIVHPTIPLMEGGRGKPDEDWMFAGEFHFVSEGLFYCNGKVQVPAAAYEEGLIIDPYELRFHHQDAQGRSRDELLLRMRFFYDTQNIHASIMYIGDLDTDGKKDLLIEHGAFRGWYYTVFLTSEAEAGRRFKSYTVGFAEAF
ncbi:MAG: hypothetical protein AAF587_39460 [Bacteroidota bacterium]